MNEVEKKIIKKILKLENYANVYLSTKDGMQSEELEDIKTDLKYHYNLLKSYHTETP